MKYMIIFIIVLFTGCKCQENITQDKKLITHVETLVDTSYQPQMVPYNDTSGLFLYYHCDSNLNVVVDSLTAEKKEKQKLKATFNRNSAYIQNYYQDSLKVLNQTISVLQNKKDTTIITRTLPGKKIKYTPWYTFAIAGVVSFAFLILGFFLGKRL